MPGDDLCDLAFRNLIAQSIGAKQDRVARLQCLIERIDLCLCAVPQAPRHHAAIHVVLCFLLGQQARCNLLGDPGVIARDLRAGAIPHQVGTTVTDIAHS